MQYVNAYLLDFRAQLVSLDLKELVEHREPQWVIIWIIPIQNIFNVLKNLVVVFI